MDHILYPTLRKEDYLTEVHHVNGEGQDTGVVYSEMQVSKRQNPFTSHALTLFYCHD